MSCEWKDRSEHKQIAEWRHLNTWIWINQCSTQRLSFGTGIICDYKWRSLEMWIHVSKCSQTLPQIVWETESRTWRQNITSTHLKYFLSILYINCDIERQNMHSIIEQSINFLIVNNVWSMKKTFWGLE